MPKIEPTKAEKAFDAIQVGEAAMRHALTLKQHYTEEEAVAALSLLKRANPKLMLWWERILGEVNSV